MQKVAYIPLKATGFLPDLVNDYLQKNPSTNGFYQNFPDVAGFENQLNLKSGFSIAMRSILQTQLKAQNKSIILSDKSSKNIEKLIDSDTFTVTTGHQLNLFTGPLYVIYKILTTLNLTETLQKQFPHYHFVPVYWMASEDHDFEEINHFWFKNQKIQWEKVTDGPVGLVDTSGLEVLLKQFSESVTFYKNANQLIDLLTQSYLNHITLADAHRFLINELFGEFGLVIIDGNDKVLKNEFKTFVISELINNDCQKEVSKTNIKLEEKYKIQVNPRAINLFYLTENKRKRIVFDAGFYKILDTDSCFTPAEISEEVTQYPERFSPNVLMRPLYQELILPNLCYVGGAGELAYWLQLKAYFNQQNVVFPVLLHRNSALILSQKQQKQLHKLALSFDDLLLPLPRLINKKIKEISKVSIDFSQERAYLLQLFKNLEQIAEQTDKSFIGAVKAQHKKQLNGLTTLENRLLKAEKRKHQAYIKSITTLYEELFPGQILQERKTNISEYLLDNKQIISALKRNFKALSLSFDVLITEQ